mgnify:CR=1 FL=1
MCCLDLLFMGFGGWCGFLWRVERTKGTQGMEGTMGQQLDLFTNHLDNKNLYCYWFEKLREWPARIYRHRHAINTTGWSMATQEFIFAELLYKDKQIDKAEYMRHFKFNVMIQSWDARKKVLGK